MAMGARPTRAGGQQFRASRHCGWPTAGAVGPVGVGADLFSKIEGPGVPYIANVPVEDRLLDGGGGNRT